LIFADDLQGLFFFGSYTLNSMKELMIPVFEKDKKISKPYGNQ
jgi:hypothetical protein